MQLSIKLKALNPQGKKLVNSDISTQGFKFLNK